MICGVKSDREIKKTSVSTSTEVCLKHSVYEVVLNVLERYFRSSNQLSEI